MATDQKAETFTVTKADLYKAACVRQEPCEAHRQTVDKMIERLESDERERA